MTNTLSRLPDRLRYFFLLSILVTIPLLTKAQSGVNCANAIALPAHGGCSSTISTSDTVRWFSILPDSTSIRIALANNNHHDSAMVELYFYSGTCSGLSPITLALAAGPEPQTKITGLTIGTTYYLKTKKLSSKPASFMVCYANVGIASVCPCPSSLYNPNNTCELVCNGSFEYTSTALTADSQIDFACPWYPLNSTPDFYHSSSVVADFDVPSNIAGIMSPILRAGIEANLV